MQRMGKKQGKKGRGSGRRRGGKEKIRGRSISVTITFLRGGREGIRKPKGTGNPGPSSKEGISMRGERKGKPLKKNGGTGEHISKGLGVSVRKGKHEAT